MKRQMSDTLQVYTLLSLSGGAMDAYSYLCRGKVFANAQTGNMLLFGVNIAERNMSLALRYIIPVIAFIFGVVISDIVRSKTANRKIHWRQITIAFEAAVLFSVCFIPQSANNIANALTSLVCGIQVESFRSVRGNPIATTMCIGNLRSGTNNLDRFFATKDRSYLKKAVLYYSVIIFFIIGAVIESCLIRKFHEAAIIFSVITLVIVCILMISGKNDDADDNYFVGD